MIQAFLLSFCFANNLSATIYTVNVTTDAGTGAAGIGDFRYCINQVNTNAAAGPHSIVFAIGTGAQTITMGSSLPTIANVVGGVTIDGFTQPGWTANPIIQIVGSNGSLGINNCPNSVIQGLVLKSGFGNPYIQIDNASHGTAVRGCWIGLDLTGNAGFGTGYAYAVVINNSNNCNIGGNLVSNPTYKIALGAMGGAVQFTGTSTNNTIRGVYSGLNAAGTAGIPNINNSHIDIGVGCNANIIGGTTAGDGNVFARSGGGHGMMIKSNNNIIKGNLMGTDATGTVAMAVNGSGIYIQDASGNIIGGVTVAERNVISSTGNYGVFIENNTKQCRNNVLYNNYIGVNKAGTTAFPNNNTGIRLKGVNKNIIGGTAAGQRNIISGNKDNGVYLENACDSNFVVGNYIGIGSDGTTVIVNGTGNNHHGIYSAGAGSGYNSYKNNVIVSPGRGSAIKYDNGGFDTISYNYCGVDATGLTLVGMGTGTNDHGINIANGNVSNMTIIGNVVAGAQGDGIRLDGTCSNYVIQGNIVGMNKDGLGTTFSNYGTGIYFANGTNKVNILIGGTARAHRNIISRNGRITAYSCSGTQGYGIIIEKAITSVVIKGNYIGVDSTGNVAAGNGGSGIMLNGGCDNVTIGGLTAGERNVVCANGFTCTAGPRHGIQFNGNSGTSYLVIGNYVGIGADGTTLLGNSGEGVSSYNTSNITIGGSTAAARNVIAGNNLGVFLQPAITGCKVLGNYIGTDATGMIAKPNTIGVQVSNGANGNIIGGSNPGEGNIIAGNTSDGIRLSNGAVSNTIQRNSIGVNAAVLALGNGGDGIHIMASSTNSNQNLIGSASSTALGNIIAYNANGVNIVDASSKNSIRRNSIYCNGSASVNGINLNGVGNINIAAPGPLVVPTYITAPTPGIQIANIATSNIAATDVVEVFYDNACGTCQGRTYLGDATNGGTGQWSYSPLPAAADCTPKPSAGCPSGVKNITATRTDNNGNTSQFMSCSPIALPVSLISFTAVKYSSSDVLIKWYTASEKNNYYFELLRSTDGYSFSPIAKIAGAGNSTSLLDYSYTDEGLTSGTYYYMLIQVDFDGKQSPTSIVQVALGGNVSVEVPTTLISAGDPIKVLNYTGLDIVSISLTDLSGKVISGKSEPKETTEFYIDSKGLASSIYLIRAQTQNEIVVKKIFVK